jgi:hypothetical protein
MPWANRGSVCASDIITGNGNFRVDILKEKCSYVSVLVFRKRGYK